MKRRTILAPIGLGCGALALLNPLVFAGRCIRFIRHARHEYANAQEFDVDDYLRSLGL